MAARKNPTVEVAREFVKRGAKAQAAVDAILGKPQAAASAPVAVDPGPMTVDELRRVGALLYGSRFQADLAEALGVSERFVHYLANGQKRIGRPTRDRLRDLVARRRQELAHIAGWL